MLTTIEANLLEYLCVYLFRCFKDAFRKTKEHENTTMMNIYASSVEGHRIQLFQG
ncbi:hypothetical protein J6590_101992, partial [Homalodisca vitripennis]